jgi:hypothetical protein
MKSSDRSFIQQSETRLARIFLLLADTAEDTEEELVMPRKVIRKILPKWLGRRDHASTSSYRKFRRLASLQIIDAQIMIRGQTSGAEHATL